MKKTKTQKEFQQQLRVLEAEGVAGQAKKHKRRFRDSKFFYYARIIVVIMVVMWLISLFDMAFYNILDYVR